MGTTKLTRKEILAEDPVHEALIRLVDLFRQQGKMIALAVASVVLLSLGIYFALQFFDTREAKVQLEFARAMDFYHARVDAAAADDPYGRGPEPLFRSETLKYQAAAKAFSDFVAARGSSKLGVGARYYLGLCQLQLGNKDEAVRNLEQVRNNSKDQTLGYLGKKTLAHAYLRSGNAKGAQEILEGMIKDPQCQLPREELRADLARVLVSQGKRDEALKVLRQARDEGGRSMLLSKISQEIDRLEGKRGAPLGSLNTISVPASLPKK